MKLQKICASGLIIKDKKILIVKRADNDDYLPGYFEIPGGKIEFGEDPKVGAAREVLEEVGIEVDAEYPLNAFSDIGASGSHVVEIVYFCNIRDLNAEVSLSEEHSEYKWITIEEIDHIYMTEKMKQSIKTAYDHSLKLL